MQNNQFTNNTSESQFEWHIDNQVAFVEYAIEDKKIYLTHTEVPKLLQGKGIGTTLLKETLKYIKMNNWTLVPLCSFVAKYVNNHPEWHSILSEGYKM